MANYNLVIDTSNFKPYDMSLDYQVLRDYRDTYRRYYDAMHKIAEEDGQYILPDTPENEEYNAIMNKYREDKKAAMEDFSRGMNLRNIRQLQDIHRRHFEEVVPINKAIESYNKDIDKITALGPDVTIANRDNRKISDYYGGVNPGIEYRSNNTIQKVAAGIVQGLDNALMSDPKVASTIAQQYFVLKSQGIDSESALKKILAHNPILNNEQGSQDTTVLIDALDNIYKQYAFAEGTPENLQIWQNVVAGAIQGIQAPKYQLQANHNFESEAARIAREAQNKHYEDLHNKSVFDYNIGKAEAEAEGYIQTGTDKDGNPVFEYDETKVKKAPKTKTDDSKVDATPYIEYGDRKFVVEGVGTGDNRHYKVYEHFQDGTNRIVQDATLRKTLIDIYDNGVSDNSTLIDALQRIRSTLDIGSSSQSNRGQQNQPVQASESDSTSVQDRIGNFGR